MCLHDLRCRRPLSMARSVLFSLVRDALCEQNTAYAGRPKTRPGSGDGIGRQIRRGSLGRSNKVRWPPRGKRTKHVNTRNQWRRWRGARALVRVLTYDRLLRHRLLRPFRRPPLADLFCHFAVRSTVWWPRTMMLKMEKITPTRTPAWCSPTPSLCSTGGPRRRRPPSPEMSRPPRRRPPTVHDATSTTDRRCASRHPWRHSSRCATVHRDGPQRVASVRRLTLGTAPLNHGRPVARVCKFFFYFSGPKQDGRHVMEKTSLFTYPVSGCAAYRERNCRH